MQEAPNEVIQLHVFSLIKQGAQFKNRTADVRFPGRATHNTQNTHHIHAAKDRNRTDQRSRRKQWFGVARGLKCVISVQGNDHSRPQSLRFFWSSGRRNGGLW